MRLGLLSGVLFLSGASALIFETLWLRVSGLVFGNSVWAAALILSSFMAGLATGNLLALSRLGRSLRPIRLYAFLEISIAILGCSVVWVVPLLGVWLRPVFESLSDQTFLLSLRFVLSFVIFLLPSAAMGLTLPVLVYDPLLREEAFGKVIGVLYGFNTLGAVVGSLVGELYLLQLLGLSGMALCAALLNCAAAAAAWSLGSNPGSASWQEMAETTKATRWPTRLLIVSGLCGASLLCLEVVWFRFLRLFVSSSSFAFAVMLAVVLFGIGLGGWLAGRPLRRLIAQPLSLAVLSGIAALATLACYIFFPIDLVQRRADAFYLDRWNEIIALSVALMFPVALLSGALFPAIVARVEERVGHRRESVSLTTLCNTIGAAIGPVLASFVLLPAFGFQTSIVICATSYLLIALLLLQSSILSSRTTVLIAVGSALIFAALLIIFPYGRRDAHFARVRQQFQQEQAYPVSIIEGNADTYQLLRRDLYGQPYYYRLVTDGFSMSATAPLSQRYMRLFAYLPLALRPQAEQALLICYGCGVTADALTHANQLKRIDIVDISKEVLSLAPQYKSYSNPLRDPRVNTFVQDGRFYLQATSRQYDIITGEPPPPKVMGAVNLYTAEFFQRMSDRLKDGGIATFWLPIYQLTTNDTKAILRAFQSAFPNASVWGSADEDWIMLGVKGQPYHVNSEELAALWDQESSGNDLRRIGMEVPQQLAALFLMDSEMIREITADTPALTDNWPKRLSDIAPDKGAMKEFASKCMDAHSAAEHFYSSHAIQNVWPYFARASLVPLFLVRETRFHSTIGQTNALAEIDFYLRGSKLRTPVLEVMGSNEFRVTLAEQASANGQPVSREARQDLIAGALAERNFSRAINLVEEERKNGTAEPNELFLLTYLYCLNGELDKAEELAAVIKSNLPQDGLTAWLWRKLNSQFGLRVP